MAKKKKKEKKEKSGGADKGTLVSICFGIGALVFAFFLIFSPSNPDGQGGSTPSNLIQQMAGGANKGQQGQGGGGWFGGAQGVAPEGRLEGPAGGGFPQGAFGSGGFPSASAPAKMPGSAGSQGGTNQNDIDAYLNGAWSSAPPQQQPNHMMMQGGARRGGFGMQRMSRFQNMMNGGAGNPMMGGNQMMGGNPMMGGNQMMGGQGGEKKPNLLQQLMGGGEGGGQDAGRVASVRGAVQNEVGLARAKASAASASMNRATNTEDAGVKQSAASEARYYANEARAAAERAASRGSGVPEVQGLISEARAYSNQAESSAQYAEQAASGW